VIRPNLDFRGFCGTVAGGIINVGDEITALPSGKTSSVKSIVTADGELETAHVGQAITLTLQDEIDVSRGDVIVRSNKLATVSEKFEATIVWMSEAALQPGKEYELKIGTKNTYGRIENINYRIDVNTLSSCTVATTSPVVIDNYDQVEGTGSFVIIDRLTNVTVGAGMITNAVVDVAEDVLVEREYSLVDKELNALIRKNYPEWNCKEI
jgi:sulfate adenylyltransferase subunit 1